MPYFEKKGAESPFGASQDEGSIALVDATGVIRVVVRPKDDGTPNDALAIAILKLLNKA